VARSAMSRHSACAARRSHRHAWASRIFLHVGKISSTSFAIMPASAPSSSRSRGRVIKERGRSPASASRRRTAVSARCSQALRTPANSLEHQLNRRVGDPPAAIEVRLPSRRCRAPQPRNRRDVPALGYCRARLSCAAQAVDIVRRRTSPCRKRRAFAPAWILSMSISRRHWQPGDQHDLAPGRTLRA